MTTPVYIVIFSHSAYSLGNKLSIPQQRGSSDPDKTPEPDEVFTTDIKSLPDVVFIFFSSDWNQKIEIG